MKNFELTTFWWTIIALAIVLWILISFLLYRWAYRRKDVVGVILVILGGLLGVIILLLLPDDSNDKNKK